MGTTAWSTLGELLCSEGSREEENEWIFKVFFSSCYEGTEQENLIIE